MEVENKMEWKRVGREKGITERKYEENNQNKRSTYKKLQKKETILLGNEKKI